MSVEQIIYTKEFEQNLPHEIERKFIPLFPEQLEEFRTSSVPIEQYYLSHPTEPYSLRLRESLISGELNYEATLKDVGVISSDGLDRMEVTAVAAENLYQLYRTDETPIIRKLRSEPYPGVTIDYFDDGRILLESENTDSWQKFVAEFGDTFVEVTGDRSSNNEWQAHLAYRRLHNGEETLSPTADLDPSSIARDILLNRESGIPLIVHIGGRSGSGKTTIVKQLLRNLEELHLSSCVLSTDDYHRGDTWLRQYNNGEPWQHWDDAIVYDTATMAKDIALLKQGHPIYRRQIDWTTVEPSYPGVIEPSDIIIIEGIYANSQDVKDPSSLSYEMTTPLATCIGRRLLRDLKERPEFADPVKSLEYMLREAEPAFRKQSTTD